MMDDTATPAESDTVGYFVLTSMLGSIVWIALSNAGIDFGVFLILFLLLGLWTLSAVVRVAIRAWRRRSDAPGSKRSFVPRGIRIEAVIVFLSIATALVGVPRWIRFQLSRDALDAFAAEVEAGREPPDMVWRANEFGNFMDVMLDTAERPPTMPVPVRGVGLFRLDEVERLEFDGKVVVRFVTTQAGSHQAGFAYSRGAPPPTIGEDWYYEIDADWYRWRRSW